MSKYFIAVIAAALAMGTPSMPNAQRSPRIQQSDINIQTLFGWSLEEQERFGFKIRNELSPWPLKLPLDWAADPYQDTNWKFNLHSWRMTDPILEAYFATGDTNLLKAAFKYANDWRRFHYLDKRTAEFSWYDMAAGIRALRIAFFIDRVESGELKVDPDAVDGLYEMADDHARRLQDENYIKPNNHGIFQVFGLNLLCMAAEPRPACANGHEFARKKF